MLIPSIWAMQILPKSQLPVLMSIIMVSQALLSAPSGIRAKRSLGDRNKVLLTGYAAMIGADLAFALLPHATGKGLLFLIKGQWHQPTGRAGQLLGKPVECSAVQSSASIFAPAEQARAMLHLQKRLLHLLD